MSATIVDRRKNGSGKSIENRQKFLKRIKESIKRSIPDIINCRKIKDIGSDGGVIHIPQKSITEPNFRHGEGGTWEVVRPGNKDFSEGDRFRKPPKGGGNGRGTKGSNSGSGEDDFIVEISRDEFLQYFFEDLELPDLVKQNLKDVVEVKYHNAGFTTTGSPAKLDVKRSLRNSHSRRIGQVGPYRRQLREAEEELADLQNRREHETDALSQDVLDGDIDELQKKIEGLKRKISHVPFLDPLDLRYHSVVAQEIPITSAVMFCLMDNSGSMGQYEKTLSRKFFSLLYMFLARKYEKIELRFIHHTTTAREVDEEEFFNTRETGGTIVSSGLELIAQILREDYSDGTRNIYICQCSDGDNWESDSGNCFELLCDDIMPYVQYYAYVQVEHEGTSHGNTSDIWPSYQSVAKEFSHFQMTQVYDDADIYPVFRKLFEKSTNGKEKTAV